MHNLNTDVDSIGDKPVGSETKTRSSLLRAYKAVAAAYGRRGKAFRVNLQKWGKALTQFEEADCQSEFMAERIEQMVSELGGPAEPLTSEAQDPMKYDHKTMAEKRANALAEHLKRTGDKTISSSEARKVLETCEGKGLHRSQVLRALALIPRLINAEVGQIGPKRIFRVISHISISGGPSRPDVLRSPDRGLGATG